MSAEPRVTVELSNEGLRVGGERQPIVAGQFEYWRNQSLYWDRILAAIRDLGIRAVSTFVCWDFHEVSPGRFDFTGETYPTRDLAGFIDACAAYELAVYIRVGPIIDAEWPTRGPAPDVATLERLHPEFWRRARQYLAVLAPVLVPRQVTHGGPIVLVGLDNEICFPYVTIGEGTAVHSAHEVEYDEPLVLSLYRGWAARRDAPEPAAPARTPDFRTDGLPETLEAFDFVTDQVGDYLEQLARACREEGIDVPLYTNMKQFTCFIDWGRLERRLGITVGANLHISNGWPGEQKLVASWYWRVLRATTRLAWAPELQGGPSIKSPDLEHRFGIMDVGQPRVNTLISAALGMRGCSYYMLVERDDTHYAPINPVGVVRPQAERLRDAIAAAGRLRPDRHLADVALIWSVDHHRCQIATQFDSWVDLFRIGRQPDEPKELPAWWAVFRDLHLIDADFGLATASDWGLFPVLIYAGPDFLAEDELLGLAEWVDAGGRLIVATALPDRDRDGRRASAFEAARRALLDSPRVLLRPWGRMQDGLRWAGVAPYVSAAGADVWSFAYEDAEGWTLFAVNTGGGPAPAGLRLRGDLAEALRTREAQDPLTGRTWHMADDALWADRSAPLAPNEVAVARVTRA